MAARIIAGGMKAMTVAVEGAEDSKRTWCEKIEKIDLLKKIPYIWDLQRVVVLLGIVIGGFRIR